MTNAERRYICRFIDFAVSRCEDANLREQFGVPRWVVDLLVHLQAAAGDQPRIPNHAIEAHGWLLDARERYMPGITSLEVAETSRPAPSTAAGARLGAADTARAYPGNPALGVLQLSQGPAVDPASEGALAS
jgi:hypothetical protein